MYNDAKELFDVIKGKRSATAVRTSSYGPRELETYTQAVKNEKEASGRYVPDIPREPRLNLPHIEDHFKSMGEAIAMCPYEVEAITESALNDPNPMVVEAFRKFIMIAKLANSDPVNEIRKDLDERRKTYDANMDVYNSQLANRVKIKSEIAEAVEDAQSTQTKAWVELLIKLQTTLQRNNKMDSLGDWDRWLVKAINKVNSRALTINSKTGEIKLVFETARKFDLEKISTALKSIDSIRINERRDAEIQWLWSAPRHELSDVMWSTNDQGIRSDIEAVLRQRQGIKRSPYDEYGRDWRSDDFDDEYALLQAVAAAKRSGRY